MAHPATTTSLDPPRSYRHLAQVNLERAAAEFGQLPQGQVHTDVMMAHAAKAQAIAQAATPDGRCLGPGLAEVMPYGRWPRSHTRGRCRH